MDTALLSMIRSGGRNRAWAETMVNLEARKLVSLANQMAGMHLSDGLTRVKFVEEIKSVIDQQFSTTRRAKTDEECVACISVLRSELENLKEQDRQLRMKAATLYAKVEFVRENNKIVGYVISAVNVVLSGIEIAAGLTLISSMTPLGVLAGAVLVTDAAMSTAEFMGFSRNSGLGIYKSVSLVANAYSVFGLFRRPETWRLFRYLPADYYRKVSTMSRPKLTMKIVGYGVKTKVIIDLLSVNDAVQN